MKPFLQLRSIIPSSLPLRPISFQLVLSNTLPSSITLPPRILLTSRIPPNQTPGADLIARAKQLRHIDIERTIRLGTCQQLVYTRHGRRDSVRRRPRRFEEIETDFSRLEVDIRVADGRDEADGGGRERVGGWDGDGEKPAAVWGVLV